MSKIVLKIKDKKPINLKLENPVVEIEPKLENIEINPSKEEQNYKSENYYGYDEVKVNGVTSEIDNNIKPENIKEGVSILGVSGNVEEVNTTEIRITPISEEQTITPEEPYNGFNKVIVGAQSGIDPNEMINTTITSSTVSNFFIKNIFKKIPPLTIDKSVKTLSYLFAYWNHDFIPRFICEKGQITNISNMCLNSQGNYDLITFFEDVDTSKVTNISYLVVNENIKRIGAFDCSSVTSLTPLAHSYQKWNNLIYLGGFINIGKGYGTYSANWSSYTVQLNHFPNLTHESLINVFNGLYDLASAGKNPQKVQLAPEHFNILTDDEIAIATNKGWNVS